MSVPSIAASGLMKLTYLATIVVASSIVFSLIPPNAADAVDVKMWVENGAGQRIDPDVLSLEQKD